MTAPGAIRPRLRTLEAFVVEHDGERMVALRDPAGLTSEIAVLPPPVLALVSLFDGERSVDEIRGALLARHGDAPATEHIAELARRLDEAGFLDSVRFAERRRAIEDEWRRGAVRPAAHAGQAYAGDRAALAAQIDGFFAHAEGPGATGPAGAGPAGAAPLLGLIAPHIDFHRGGPTYAWAYRELARRSDADLFVVLGTCHAGMADPFAITLKTFATPGGDVAVDRDLYEAVAARAGQALLASELAHRHEHSVEFQAVMLRHALGDRPFTILPVLASYLHEAIWRGAGAEEDPRVPRFVDALRSALAASSRRVCLVAGVDLAHVGPRFGDAEPNTPDFLGEVAAADRAMLEPVVAGDAKGFYASVAADGDRRRICGLSPIHTFLLALGGVRGRLIRYSQWPDPEGAVTFCAAAFP